ncbi:hypothetical protein, partial [Pseudomonas syringae group genomosp. 7]|uniref:hypothetical protein n=1 Tax=Pseudomonas syringae group genomosp. 7 TaxID=251699 RepID=UPI0037702086
VTGEPGKSTDKRPAQWIARGGFVWADAGGGLPGEGGFMSLGCWWGVLWLFFVFVVCFCCWCWCWVVVLFFLCVVVGLVVLEF